MNGMLKFDKVRWGAAILAGVLLFGAVLVSAQSSDNSGHSQAKARYPQIDSVADDGDGHIRISWSLYVPSTFNGVSYTGNPSRIFVEWHAQTGTGFSNSTELNDSSSTNPENDLVVDLGIGDNPAIEEETYTVKMAVDYPHTSWFASIPVGGVSVTVQGGATPDASSTP